MKPFKIFIVENATFIGKKLIELIDQSEKISALPRFLFMEIMTKVKISKRKVLHRIEAADIIWVKYVNNGIQIFSEGNEETLHKKNLQLSTFYKEHPYPFFLQISQTTLINQEKIIGFLPDTDEVIMVHNSRQTFLSVTKTYRKSFMQFINQRKIKSQ